MSRKVLAAVLGAIVAAGLTVVTTGPAAADPPAEEGQDEVAIEFVIANDRVSREEAIRRLAAQDGQTATADRLARELGDRSGGAWIDRRTGELVVNIVDDRDAATVAAAGARPDIVEFSLSELDALRARFDEVASSGDTGRVDSWYVDVMANRFVVTVIEGDDDPATSRLLEFVREAGDMATVQPSDGAKPQLGGLNVYAGTAINNASGGCSAGFAAKDVYNNRYMITAAHCVWTDANVKIGATHFGQRSYYNATFDEAAVLNWYTWYWFQQPKVWQYNGNLTKTVVGVSQAPVNSVVCKSGMTTGWTCGTIQQYGVNAFPVLFPDNTIKWLAGMVKTNMCFKKGDSGGPVMAGNWAQGTMSSGTMYAANGAPWVSGPVYCGWQVGKPNVSYYQPLAWTLYRAGLSIVT